MLNVSEVNSLTRQKGAASIIFLAATPFLFMILAFAISTAQKLITHAKMLEATEIASLALATDLRDNGYASELINRYLIDNTGNITANIIKETCDLKSGCVLANNESSEYTDVTVVASSNHKSWISYKSINLQTEFSVGGKSKARKYSMRPIDLYFITDFSDSMAGNRNIWGFRIPGPNRLEWVKTAMSDVFRSIKTMDKSGQSRVSLQGFNHYHIKETDKIIREANTFFFSGRSYKQKIIYNYERGSAFATVRDMFKPPGIIGYMVELNERIFINLSGRLHNDRIARDYPYYDIKLTSNIDYAINRIGGLNANKGSASWNGIIAAAQEAYNAPNLNPEQFFVVLSDGHDDQRWKLKEMVDQGLCSKLTTEIQKKKSNLATNTSVHMIAIGLNYDINPNEGLGSCVGPKSIYRANSANEIHSKIMNIIKVESGRLRN